MIFFTFHTSYGDAKLFSFFVKHNHIVIEAWVVNLNLGF